MFLHQFYHFLVNHIDVTVKFPEGLFDLGHPFLGQKGLLFFPSSGGFDRGRGIEAPNIARRFFVAVFANAFCQIEVVGLLLIFGNFGESNGCWPLGIWSLHYKFIGKSISQITLEMILPSLPFSCNLSKFCTPASD